MAEKSKILIIGGTGYIGKYILEASAKSDHPTFALVREGTVSDPAKASLIEGFKNSGVTLLHGDLDHHESLVKAIKQVDVVISTVGHGQLADETKIIAAIKEAGNVKIMSQHHCPDKDSQLRTSQFPPRVLDQYELLEIFNKRKPSEFSGCGDPMEADAWIIEMERIFRMLPCTGGQRVQLATYMLRDVAEFWWIAVRTRYTNMDDAVAWETFKEQFFRKFIPAPFRSQKLREFEQLRQEGSTVMEYEAKFIRLSRFAERLITPESEKIRRFVDGLRADIQLYMPPTELPTYEAYVERAIWAEDALQKVALTQLGASKQTKMMLVYPEDDEEDIGTYTIKDVDDPRTLNKILYVRPPANTLSLNNLVSLREKKIRKNPRKDLCPRGEVLEAPIPVNVILSIGHLVFVKGERPHQL